jgi:hypothetical protein
MLPNVKNATAGRRKEEDVGLKSFEVTKNAIIAAIHFKKLLS